MLYQEQVEVLIKSAAIYIDIVERKGKASAKKLESLESYRQPLLLMRFNPSLGPIASKTIEAMDHALEYVKTGDKQALERLRKAHHDADELINKLQNKRGEADGS